jgi:FAD synthase
MVRPEQKFHSLEELKEQMLKDIQYGEKYYTNITKITEIC